MAPEVLFEGLEGEVSRVRSRGMDGSEFTFMDDDDDSELGSAPLVLRAALYGSGASLPAAPLPALRETSRAMPGTDSRADLPAFPRARSMPALEKSGSTHRGPRRSLGALAALAPMRPPEETARDSTALVPPAPKQRTVLFAAAGLSLCGLGYALAWLMNR